MNPDKSYREVKVKINSSHLLLIGSIIAFIGGIAAFLYLFLPDFNIYWLILSPVILACYQIPAATLYWLYKKAGRKQNENGDPVEDKTEPNPSDETTEPDKSIPDPSIHE